MTFGHHIVQSGRGLALGGAILAAVGLTAAPRPAHALDNGAAVGLGLGSFALGAAVGSAANPYNNPYNYAYGSPYPPAPAYAPAPAYYPPATYQPRSCWDPYSQRYYACWAEGAVFIIAKGALQRLFRAQRGHEQCVLETGGALPVVDRGDKARPRWRVTPAYSMSPLLAL